MNHYFCEWIRKAPEFWPKKRVTDTLAWMESVIDRKDDDVIVIESHTSYFSEWGESLAKRVRGRNFCFILDEIYNNYGAKGFLYFKFKRRELAVIHEDCINALFGDYEHINNPEKYRLGACPTRPVEDLETNIQTNTEKYDINILYLGRYKQYCEEVKKGVWRFALRHPNKNIQFLIIGEMRNVNVLSNLKNIDVKELGFMNPIPRKLFKGINVGIAGSGSASTIAREGIPTVVTNPNSFFASGILGYTVFDTLSKDNNYKYEDIIDEILFGNILSGKAFLFPEPSDPDNTIREHFLFLENANDNLEYFDFDKYPQNNFTSREKIGFYMRRYFMAGYKFLIRMNKKNPFKRK